MHVEKIKPLELAAIKTCFDLKRQGLPIDRTHIACFLHLAESDHYTLAQLKSAQDKVDQSLRKIKKLIYSKVVATDESLKLLEKQFGWEHVTEVFKTYAYFGLYPVAGNSLYSYLQTKMGDWATEQSPSLLSPHFNVDKYYSR